VITILEITVGDTGFTLAGRIDGGGLVDLVGCTVTLDLIRTDGGGVNMLSAAPATITNAVKRRVACKLTNAVGLPAEVKVRWTVTLPGGAGIVHAPGPEDEQVYLKLWP